MKFSANLGFLWADLPLTQAIERAALAEFDAVECHWPYDTPAATCRAALEATGLKMLGLNTRRGNTNGLSAQVDHQADARAALEEAFDYGAEIGAQNVHAMAGIAQGPSAHDIYLRNLDFACDLAKARGMHVLIEPLNPYDAPGYFLNKATQAAEVITQIARPELKMMFDFYHQQVSEGDILRSFARFQPIIGHVQIAACPNRTRPDHGELTMAGLLSHIAALGWQQPIGAEYRPNGETEATLGWLPHFKTLPAKRIDEP